MISLDEESYIVGMWFSSCPKTDNNWLACVIRDPKNPKVYKGWSRFRYVRDNKIFDSKDEKSWTEFTSKEGLTDKDMIENMRLSQKVIQEGYPDMDEIIVMGDIVKASKLCKGKPWMNIQVHTLQ